MRQPLAILVLVLAAFVAADPLDDAIAMMKRQNDNNSTTSSVTSLTSSSPSLPPTTSTITPPPSVSTVTSTSTFTPTSSEEQQESSSSEEAESSSSSPSLTQIETSATQEITTTFTYVSEGSTLVGTRTSSTVVPTTTDVDPATLRDGERGGGNSGLSDSAKKTIGGVVGGIGGALLLAGLAYTAWRVWGKKKNLHDDDLYDPNVQQEKMSTSTDTANTPFRSNLEQYHQPGPVNTASNF